MRKPVLWEQMAFKRNAMLHECRRKGARALNGDVLEANGAHGHLRAIELRFGFDGSERLLIGVLLKSTIKFCPEFERLNMWPYAWF